MALPERLPPKSSMPQEPSPMQEIKGGFVQIGKGVQRAVKESALQPLKVRSHQVAKVVVDQLAEFLAKPAVIRAGIHLSLIEGKLKEIAGDIGKTTLTKLGFKNKIEGQIADCSARFKVLHEGLEQKKDQAADPNDARRLTKLQTSIADAKSQAEEAHRAWKRVSTEHVKARAELREARHLTDLARIDVRVARDHLAKAEAEFAPYEHLNERSTRRQWEAQPRLRAKVSNAKEALRRADGVRNARLREEEEAYDSARPLENEEKKLKGELTKALRNYEGALKQAKRMTLIKPPSILKKFKAGAKKLKENALETGSKALITQKAKTAVVTAIEEVEKVRATAGLPPLNAEVKEKVKTFLKQPKAVNLHEIGDAIRHQDREELSQVKSEVVFSVEKANLFYQILRDHGIGASTIYW